MTVATRSVPGNAAGTAKTGRSRGSTDRDVVLLWGHPSDSPLRAVHERLLRRGVPTLLLDQRRVRESRVELEVGQCVRGRILCGNEQVDLSRIRSAYIRPHDAMRLPCLRDLPPDHPERRRAMAMDDALLTWCELTEARIVNPPEAMASNNSKPYQIELIRAAGFEVPDTLLTTDPDAAAEFWERHGQVIYKSISGVRSVVSRLREEHMTRLWRVGACPTQFQRCIAGVDHRVHVVGRRVFASRIETGVDDYRYAGRQGQTVAITPATLPRPIADRCRVLAERLGLPVAGIDLRLTPEGRWCCFEVNPSPAFTYYQEATGQDITGAVAEWLAPDDRGRE